MTTTYTVPDTDFAVIKIIDSNFKDLNNKCAIVPVKFLVPADLKHEYIVPYLNPPYGDKDKRLIQDIVQNRCDPPVAWGNHKCVIIKLTRKYFFFQFFLEVLTL